MNKHWIALLALGLMMTASRALAQDDDGWTAGPESSDLQVATEPVTDPNEDVVVDSYGTTVPEETTGQDEVAYSQRGITLPAGTLRADATFSLLHFSIDTGFGTVSDTATFLSLGAAYGIMDNLEVGVSGYRQGAWSTGAGTGLLPFQLTKDFNFGWITPYARYRGLHSEMLQTAGELTVLLPTAKNSDFGLMVGGTFRLMLAQMIGLDTGLYSEVTFASSIVTDLIVPVGVIVNVTPALFLLARMNFIYVDFEDRVLSLDFGAGYTMEGADGPMLDIMATFGFPYFLTNGQTVTELWQVNLTAAFRLGT